MVKQKVLFLYLRKKKHFALQKQCRGIVENPATDLTASSSVSLSLKISNNSDNSTAFQKFAFCKHLFTTNL